MGISDSVTTLKVFVYLICVFPVPEKVFNHATAASIMMRENRAVPIGGSGVGGGRWGWSGTTIRMLLSTFNHGVTYLNDLTNMN